MLQVEACHFAMAPCASRTLPHGGRQRRVNVGQQEEDGEQPVTLITVCAKGGIRYRYFQAFMALGCRMGATATDIPDGVPGLARDVPGEFPVYDAMLLTLRRA